MDKRKGRKVPERCAAGGYIISMHFYAITSYISWFFLVNTVVSLTGILPLVSHAGLQSLSLCHINRIQWW